MNPTPPTGEQPTTDRAATNRANSQHSTGPRTEAGKQRTRLNALRHGLTGQTVVLPEDDLDKYQKRNQEFFTEYKPKGPTEMQLVQVLALAETYREQKQIMANPGMHGQRLARLFKETLKQLTELQAERRNMEKDAAIIMEMHKEEGLPYDPTQDGFVFQSRNPDLHPAKRSTLTT